MGPVSRFHGRGRELAVLAAGFAAAAALAWAGATVSDGMRSAGEVAVARLSAAVGDTVTAEWERMRRAPRPPGLAHGVVEWSRDGASLVPLELRELEPGAEPSVFETLLAEAERLELVEDDAEAALELVREALAKEPHAGRELEARLRALQLAARTGREDVVREQWDVLCRADLAVAQAGIPYRLLAALGVPAELRDAPPVTAAELERLFTDDDRFVLAAEDGGPTFELAALVGVLTRRLGLAEPPLGRRRALALERAAGPLPAVPADGLWHVVELAARPLAVRADVPADALGVRCQGAFLEPSELAHELAAAARLPEGFALDLAGGAEELGPAVRPRIALAGSPLAFTLRHADPDRLARAEASRLRLLRVALFALAAGCAGGGLLTARVIARQRRLAALRTAFVSGVSHDLRSPAAAILLLTENLESGAGDPARTHRALRKEAARLRRLVEDVLDFARMERGETVRLVREDVDLPRLVDGLERDLGARAADAGRPFRVERGRLPEGASLDAEALRRALENLVENALKHGRGAVTLAVDADEAHVRFAVADEGPGVDAEARERVFEPFERLGANGHVGGTGLGLAIVRAIARGHGGEARVAGARFTIEVPLEAREARTEEHA